MLTQLPGRLGLLDRKLRAPRRVLLRLVRRLEQLLLGAEPLGRVGFCDRPDGRRLLLGRSRFLGRRRLQLPLRARPAERLPHGRLLFGRRDALRGEHTLQLERLELRLAEQRLVLGLGLVLAARFPRRLLRLELDVLLLVRVVVGLRVSGGQRRSAEVSGGQRRSAEVSGGQWRSVEMRRDEAR